MPKITSKSGVPLVTAADESLPVDMATGWVATTNEEKSGVSLYVGTGGDLKFRMVRTPSGTYRTWKNIPSGSYVLANVIEVHPDSTCDDVQILF